MRLSLYDDPKAKSLTHKVGTRYYLSKTFQILGPNNSVFELRPENNIFVTIEGYALLIDNTLGYALSFPTQLEYICETEHLESWIINKDILEEYFTESNSTITRLSVLDYS